MTTDISRSSKLIDLCLRTLALEDRARLDRASIALLERSRREAEAVAARLRAGCGPPQVNEALGHAVVLTACIRRLLERGASMNLEARRRVIDDALERLHQLDDLDDNLG